MVSLSLGLRVRFYQGTASVGRLARQLLVPTVWGAQTALYQGPQRQQVEKGTQQTGECSGTEKEGLVLTATTDPLVLC
jgi:hypothetical protein